MGDTLSPKITDKVLYIQHIDRSRTTAMDGGSADIAGAIAEEQLSRSSTPVDSTDYFRFKILDHQKMSSYDHPRKHVSGCVFCLIPELIFQIL